MRLARAALGLFAVAAALGALAASALALPGGNLIANPGGEAEPGLEGGLLLGPTGWTQTATIEAGEQGAYDSCYGGSDSEREVLDRSTGDAIGGGARFFFGGEVELSLLSQEVAVDSTEAAGRSLLIGGFFGGFADQEDHASLSAHFLNGTGTELGTAVTAPVTAADRGNITSLLRREASAVVPAGTAKIRFVLSQVREDGSDNDGYADDLFATFDGAAPPAPATGGDPRCPHAASQPPSPAVAITSGPPPESAQSAARFSFAGTAGGSFECSLDGGPWKSCVSGGDFGPAAPGDHRFEVREKLGAATSAPASYRWTVDLPKACVLRVARARVFVYAKRPEVRLVIHYTSYRSAKVSVAYKASGSKGPLDLGSASARFGKAGVFRLPVRLGAGEIAKARAARSFAVRFRIPKTPASCARYYSKRLTIPQRVSGQTVWFQSDSRFAPGT